ACSTVASRWSAPLGSRRWRRSPDAASPDLRSPPRFLARSNRSPRPVRGDRVWPIARATLPNNARAGTPLERRRIPRILYNHSKARCRFPRTTSQAEPLKCQRLVGPGLANGRNTRLFASPHFLSICLDTKRSYALACHSPPVQGPRGDLFGCQVGSAPAGLAQRARLAKSRGAPD